MSTPINPTDICSAPTRGASLLSNFERDWAYARASEASTLFINESVASPPPYMRIHEAPGACFALESFDGKKRDVYAIVQVAEKGDELNLQLAVNGASGAKDTVFTLYPYWDIDDTWVVIQDIPGLEEKPIRFAVPQRFADRIEVLPDGYP